ncbi:MAG: hypothetical protein WAZ48_17295 [Lysobacteraceae bacterium]
MLASPRSRSSSLSAMQPVVPSLQPVVLPDAHAPMTPPRSRSSSLSAMQPVVPSLRVVPQVDGREPMSPPRSRSSSLSSPVIPMQGPRSGQMEPFGTVPSPVERRAVVASPMPELQGSADRHASSADSHAFVLPDSQRRLSQMPLSQMPPHSPRRDTAININEAPHERSALLSSMPQPQSQSEGQGWSPTAVNVATIAAQTTDAIGAGLSLSTAIVPHSATVRNLVSGSSWAVSGAISTATGRGTNAPLTTGTGVLNALAGASSVASTAFGTVDSPSWQADQASLYSSYASNALWAGAGLATIADGVNTMRGARNWSATFAGTAQIASGAANMVAGAAGALSTYWQGQNPVDPRAATAAMVSGAAWVTGSAFGAIGAGLSWYSRRGSASPSITSAHPEQIV